jgi:hypothetical protein
VVPSEECALRILCVQLVAGSQRGMDAVFTIPHPREITLATNHCLLSRDNVRVCGVAGQENSHNRPPTG